MRKGLEDASMTAVLGVAREEACCVHTARDSERRNTPRGAFVFGGIGGVGAAAWSAESSCDNRKRDVRLSTASDEFVDRRFA